MAIHFRRYKKNTEWVRAHVWLLFVSLALSLSCSATSFSIWFSILERPCSLQNERNQKTLKAAQFRYERVRGHDQALLDLEILLLFNELEIFYIQKQFSFILYKSCVTRSMLWRFIKHTENRNAFTPKLQWHHNSILSIMYTSYNSHAIIT